MIKARKISNWLLLLMVFLQVGLPAVNFNEQSQIYTHDVSIDQVSGDIDYLNPDWIYTENGDNFSNRVELGSTVFYTLQQFSLDLFHVGMMRVQWLLSHLVYIQFDRPDIIFPFAYFW